MIAKVQTGQNTLPKAPKAKGYATALVGKYHLGQPTSPAEGFDTWVTHEDGPIRSFYRNKIFYNADRPHTALDKRTPDDAYFEPIQMNKAA